MSLSTRYTPSEIESKWYDHWMAKDYFTSKPDEREAYSIVIPPPNVTGVLHMGHMLNNTIQDILIRRARLQGKNACWVPGTDHASIATEAKVVKKLRAEGIKKSDLTREEFLAHAFQWKEEYGGKILGQLKKLGASCDWSRTRFTMEPKMSAAVVKVFVDLHKKGKLYRGKRMTNWDPQAQTVLSNEEVIHGDENSRLYYVKYLIEGTKDEYLTIATVRPETILGDSAIAINPKDKRFAHLRGKRAIVPMVGRSIPIIEDDYVDIEFGTGCLKVTPAHDMNDYEIGQRHNLEVIDILNADGTMAETAGFYIGEDREKARKLIFKELERLGHIEKVEDYRNSVGRSERTGAVVEPRLTLQWFLDMKDFSATALGAVKDGDVKFLPEHFFNTYNNWLREDNVRDWCISRQLWWGQQIPAWYYGDDNPVVAETEEEALEIARKESGNADLTMVDLTRDEDVVDTWFSSWLWPISVFDGFEHQEDLKYYYPTNVLVTGWDIMYLWVARMVMAGYEWSEDLLGKEFVEKNGKQPFQEVFFTGMVRDANRKKMSKQLGNSPDALKLIEIYGADGVRFGMLSSAAAGNDIIFDAPYDKKTKITENSSKLCETGRNFCNKMWNALRLIKGFEVVDKPQDKVSALAVQWIEDRFNSVLPEIEDHYKTYRFGDIAMTLRSLIWDDFCSWFLEMIKPEYQQPIDRKTVEQAEAIFSRMMTLLHPFMPFVTEEIWYNLREQKTDCVVSEYPKAGGFDKALIAKIEKAKGLVSVIRETRSSKGMKLKEKLQLYVAEGESAKELFALDGLEEMVIKMADLSKLTFTNDEPENVFGLMSGTEKYFLESTKTIDVAAECAQAKEDLAYQQGFIKSVMKKLGNERFVAGAPEQVVANERKKLADGEAKVKILEETLQRLGCA
ncbi:MAG: valyl-tRNA synthetase [Paraglaciecola sp.]|jgi:valyl-tRNA synthetase